MGYFQKILRITLVGTIGTLLLYMFLVGRITFPPDWLGIAVFWLIVGWLFESAFGDDGGSASRTYYRDYTPHNDTNNFEFDGYSDETQKEEEQKRQEQEYFDAYYEKQKQDKEEEERRWQEMQEQKEEAWREEQERQEEAWREQQEREQEWREAQRLQAESDAAWAREQEKNAEYDRERDYYHNYGNSREEDAKRYL